MGDWSTLSLYAKTQTANTGSLNAGAVLVTVFFYQLSGMSTIPKYGNLTPVGGRTLCVGLSNQRAFYLDSQLDVRIPIIAPYVEIAVRFPTNQVDTGGLDIGAWVLNEPSYQYTNPLHSGYTSAISPAFGGDSILGVSNSGFVGDTSRGVLVPAGTTFVNEFLYQTIGKGYFTFNTEDLANIPPNPTEIDTWVCNKSSTDTGGILQDQVLYSFGNVNYASQGGIPLTGFRQGVRMTNNTAPPRSIVWHWAIYPEF